MRTGSKSPSTNFKGTFDITPTRAMKKINATVLSISLETMTEHAEAWLVFIRAAPSVRIREISAHLRGDESEVRLI